MGRWKSVFSERYLCCLDKRRLQKINCFGICDPETWLQRSRRSSQFRVNMFCNIYGPLTSAHLEHLSWFYGFEDWDNLEIWWSSRSLAFKQNKPTALAQLSSERTRKRDYIFSLQKNAYTYVSYPSKNNPLLNLQNFRIHIQNVLAYCCFIQRKI